MAGEPARVMFLYWGRRGAMTAFTLEAGRAALADPRIAATISISRQNEKFDAYGEFGGALFPVDTFRTDIGALGQAWRIPILRRRLLARLRRDRTRAVIELMPHVWSPFVVPVIRQAGVRYATVVHDADPHPGDRTAWVKGWLDRAMPHADLVLTLSEAVAGRLLAAGRVPTAKLYTLFHPDLTYAPASEPQPPAPAPGEPLRLLFLGRILPYKGLPLFLDAVDLLREEGIAVEVGVYGEGPLGASAGRLAAMGAEVVNRWLTGAEIGMVLSRYHALVLSHVEASQSGVAATALGAGLPVVATPVGGLIEQVADGLTGAIALRANAPALKEAIQRLVLDPQLYRAVRRNIARTRDQRSMARFVEDCVSLALHAGS